MGRCDDCGSSLSSPATAVLHNTTGGGRGDLRVTFDETSAPALVSMRGQPARGDWTPRVRDLARRDVGTLEGWTLTLSTE